MTETTRSAPTAQTSGFTTSQIFQAVRDNFVVISGGAIVLGIVVATTFLTTYLTAFDWHLLWFVEYTDIITFGLLAVGIILGSLALVQSIIQAVLNLFQLEPPSRRRWLWGSAIFAVVLVALTIWTAVHAGHGYFHIIWGIGALLLGCGIILLIGAYIRSGALPSVAQFVFLLLLIVSNAAAMGWWLGYSVLEVGTAQEIKLKDGSFGATKVIIVMSRHTILLKDNDIFVVPTGDVLQFHSTIPGL
jgi:hypothetical protein